QLFRVPQLLLAVEPLGEQTGLDDAGAVRTELHGTDHRGHVGGGDRVAYLVAVGGARLRQRGGEDLHAGVARTRDGIGRPPVLLRVRLVQFLHAGRLEAVVPAGGEDDVVAVLAEVLRPDRRIGAAGGPSALRAVGEL